MSLDVNLESNTSPEWTWTGLGPYLDVLHSAFERADRLRDQLQPVACRGVKRPHPGRLRVRRRRAALLLLRLVRQIVLILQHLHFQQLPHHVSAWAGGRSGRGSRKWNQNEQCSCSVLIRDKTLTRNHWKTCHGSVENNRNRTDLNDVYFIRNLIKLPKNEQ